MSRSLLTLVTLSIAFQIVGCSKPPEPLSASDRAYMEKRIPELEREIRDVEADIEHRRSIGGLGDEIGTTGPETWSQRFQSEIDYHQSLITAFRESLVKGVKVLPPERFRKSCGYCSSPDKFCFVDD